MECKKMHGVNDINYTTYFFVYCFTVHFDSLDLIHTNQCTFSYKDVSLF